jgi:hypothetical protein
VLTWDDVARACLALPATSEAVSASGRRRWLVRGKTFVRERPLHRRDLDELEPDVWFTTSHFDGWPALMCRLDALDRQALTELAGDAWASRAPRRLLAEHPVAGS